MKSGCIDNNTSGFQSRNSMTPVLYPFECVHCPSDDDFAVSKRTNIRTKRYSVNEYLAG